ncbi:MAG: C25 family cysteine peptidase [candidate division WOR-3 bacterium]
MKCILALLPLTLAAARPPADYLIVAPARLASGFEPLIHWKTRKGLWTELVPIETVLVRSSGRDRAEKLRNFICRWHDSLGTSWVLLAGDTTTVPTRMVATPGNITELSPCDMYFSDLDRDWDANGNDRFGEETDSVDMYADVDVGRAVVCDTAQVSAVVRKWLEFELGPESGYLRKLLLAGDSLSLTLPPGWFLGSLSRPPTRQELPDSLNSGYQFVSHVGHSDGTMLLVGTQVVLNLADVYNLRNRNRQNVFLTVGSQAGAIDRPSIGTALLAQPDAGSVAVLANSRAGWLGRSEMLSHLFLARFFATDTLYEIGRNFSCARNTYVPLARTDRYWRQTLYVWHLLGEPGLSCWKDTAQALDVTHPVVIDTGFQDFPVEVRSGGAPVRGFVCLWQDDQVYQRCWVQGSGSITIHPRVPGELLVTVTSPDHRPYLGSCGIATACAEPHAHRPMRCLCRPSRAGIVVQTSLPARVRVFDAAGRCEQGWTGLRPDVCQELSLRPGIKFVVLATDGDLLCRKVAIIR